MPPIVAGVVVALAYVGAGAAGYIAMTTAVIMAVVSVASAAVSYALTSKAKAPGFSSLSGQRLVTSRDSVRAREIVYGRIRKGGVLLFLGTHDGQVWLNLVIGLAGHQCEAIEEVYCNEQLALDAYGVQQDPFIHPALGPMIFVEKFLGWPNQQSNGTMMVNFPGIWTREHYLRGITHLDVYVAYNIDRFKAVPNVTAVVKGRRVYDPRTGVTAWSDNPALCLADYLHDSVYGLGAAYDTDISTAALIAAANICDELVAIPGGTEKRYTCNGILSSAEEPQSNIEMLLSSMAGRLLYSGGQWIIKAGAYEAPTVTLGDSDFRGRLQVQTRQQRRDLCNAVRGVYVAPERAWQLTDFPPCVSDTFAAQDNGERIWRDVELPFTTSATMAYRLAKIELYGSREQIALTVPVSLKALQLRAGDTVAITHARLGWTAKAFLITEWSFAMQQDDQGAPVLGCQLALRETSSAVYDCTADEQRLIEAAPDSGLSSAWTCQPPGIPSVTEELYSTRDGAGVKVVAHVSWAASPDAFVSQYQLEYKLVTAATWTVAGRTPDTRYDLSDIAPGRYSMRVKAINGLQTSSAYATAGVIEIVGLLAPPAAITGLTLAPIAGFAVLRWTRHPDLDVRTGGYIVIRHSPLQTGATWQGSVSIGDAVPGSDTVAILPLKAGTYLAKAKDSSGVFSRTAASVSTAADTVFVFVNINTITEHPAFTGAKVETVVVSNKLKLDALGNVDDWGNVDDVGSWDAASGISPSGTYTFAVGFDFISVTRARLKAHIAALVVNELDLMDSRAANMDAWQDFDGTGVADADCQVWARTTNDDPSGSPTWGAWQRLDTAEVYCRGVQCQARLSTDDPAYNIEVSELSVSADGLA